MCCRQKKDSTLYGGNMVETNAEKRRETRRQRAERRKKLHRMLGIICAGVAVLMVGIIAAALFSGDAYKDEDSFKSYASSWFEEGSDTKSVGDAKEVVKYGTPLSTAMEYPITGEKTTDTYIRNIAQDLEKQFRNEHKKAKKEEKIALLLDYNSYHTKKDAVGLVFSEEQRKEKDKNMETVSSQVYTYNFSTETGRPLTAIQIFNPGYKEQCSAYLLKYFEKAYPKDLVKDYKQALENSEKNFNKYVLTETGVTFYFDKGTVVSADKGLVSAEISYKDLEGIIRDKIAVRAIDPDKPMVALTFDDGPYDKTSNRILDCLEKYDALATFFELGQNVANYPKVVKREAELGMEIGSHSWSHPNLKTLSAQKVKSQVDKTNKALEKACGQTATVFRPPYGNSCKALEKCAKAPIILWSVDTLDWKSRNAASVMKVMKGIKNLDGRVVLMHSIYDSTAEAVEKMVPWLLEKGYQLVTVSELLEYRYDETPKNGKLYGYGYFYVDK